MVTLHCFRNYLVDEGLALLILPKLHHVLAYYAQKVLPSGLELSSDGSSHLHPDFFYYDTFTLLQKEKCARKDMHVLDPYAMNQPLY
ncbi:hypothetical protein EUGRSUZ_J00696 [Eucalyptus grandis]|uniref:Uncharacterized protein n=2 Tax=Eucalyptus grandis TaxID=71139 RepID=A0ACC3J483_EUCGR|nr:hypothetical protein EUGRSUZ_J00696 [Eucalyptus grandis]